MLHTFRCLRQRRAYNTAFAQTRCYAKQAKEDEHKRRGQQISRNVPKKQGRNFIFRALPSTHTLTKATQLRSNDMDLPIFRPKSLTLNSVGTAMLFHLQNDSFHAYGLPRNLLLEFRLLPQPCSVVREVTLKATNTLDLASKSDSRVSRIVLTGDTGCGKSFLLLQSVNYALSSGWIVLYIPRAINLLNSSTPYQYDLRTQTYQQPEFSKEILRRFMSVNEMALQPIHIQDTVRIEKVRTFDVGTPLTRIIEIGVNDSNVAPEILSVVLEQLGRQTQHPVLLAVDDFQALFCMSEYRDPDFNRIRSHHLSVPRLLLEYAGGQKYFSRGAFFGALSGTNTTFRSPPALREVLELVPKKPADLYTGRSTPLVAYMKGLRPFPVPSHLTLDEAASLFDVWKNTLALHTEPNDALFMEKYMESSGNARQFVWKGLLATLES